MKTDKKNCSCGILITKMGKKAFDSEREVENLLRYITRTRKKDKKEVLWGARFVQRSKGIETVIQQYKQINSSYPRNVRNGGRRCYHEYFSFSGETGNLEGREKLLEEMAFCMSEDYKEAGYGVVYAVHAPDREDRNYHIHFAVNTVCIKDGRKLHDFFYSKEQREARFNTIAGAYFQDRN